MKKASLVWQCFDKLYTGEVCTAVSCKLCDKEYKFFGNTTNLRQHLVNKHPIQWEMLVNGTLNDETIQNAYDDEENHRTSRDRLRFKNVSDTDDDTSNTIHIVEHIANNDVEWLEEDTLQGMDYKPLKKRRKVSKQIKREVLSPQPKRFSNYYIQKPNSYEVETAEPEKKDELSAFGEYVGNKLKGFKSAQTRSNLQQLITTLLWQAEYGLYNSMDSVKKVLMFAVQEPEANTSTNMATETGASAITISTSILQEPTDCLLDSNSN